MSTPTDTLAMLDVLGVVPADAELLVSAGYDILKLRAAAPEDLAAIHGIGLLKACAVVRAVQSAPQP